MSRHALEVADLFRLYGEQWRIKQAGHISHGQYRVMSAIENCRTASMGGHVLHCHSCGETEISYNSCRNRHCPKCQSAAAYRWLAHQQANLLPVEYYHLVFTLPAPISDLAYSNKALLYEMLFQSAAQTLKLIAADPRHLGAKIGATLVLHTWGSAMTHHPHVHGIVPGGGISIDGEQWIACRPGFFLPVRVLSRLFRRLFLEQLTQAYQTNRLQFFGEQQPLKVKHHFTEWIKPLRQCEWVVYAKRPFSGPDTVLAYLARYTHRVAIANSRLLSCNDGRVTFKWKDYRKTGKYRHKTMTLEVDEFIRRFLIHVLPSGFHRIRHYGLLSNAHRRDNLKKARSLLQQKSATALIESDPVDTADRESEEQQISEKSIYICRHCGAVMSIVESFLRGQQPRAPPAIEALS